MNDIDLKILIYWLIVQEKRYSNELYCKFFFSWFILRP